VNDPMPFIIDGYNLLHSIRKTSEDWDAVGDIRLCHVLGRFFQKIGEKGEIVFDGKGPPEKSRFENIEKLEVLFTGLKSDADTVIENKIESSTAPKGLTIVSSDRRIRRAGRSRKTTVMKSEEFWIAVCKRLSRNRKKVVEPLEKRRGLNEGETKQWMKYFGIDEQ
jgi:predicted RNA-binding protein with PIN domain